MKFEFSALLVQNLVGRFEAIRPVLETLSVGVRSARTCKEVEVCLSKPRPPHLVLTEAILSDGSWKDVVDLAGRVSQRINVIVVSPSADVELYVDAMNGGAFDFIMDSFTVSETLHVFRCAVDNAVISRESAKKPPSVRRREPLLRAVP